MAVIRDRLPGARAALISELGREPTLVEVAKRLGCSVTRVWQIYGDLSIETTAGAAAKTESRRAARIQELGDIADDEPKAILRAAPGRNLVSLLEARGMSLVDFAVQVLGDGVDRGSQDRAEKHSRIRKYTHPAPGSQSKWPTPATIAKWAKALGVHPSEFYARAK